ncbi:MAG: hypothetical protein ABIG69_09600 [Bacteroidota bacterium]
MGLDLDDSAQQTPINEDEKSGLLIKTISAFGELNEFEQLNVEKAIEWTIKVSLNTERILTDAFTIELHFRMFNNVWRWAEQFRNSNKNIGVDKFQIGIEIRNLPDDCKFWISNKSFSEEGIAG